MVSLRVLFTAVIVLVALERLVELRLSNRHARRAFAAGAVEVGQRHYRVMKALHALFLVACVSESWLLARPFPGAIGVLALLGAVLAQVLRWWAIRTLGDRWTTRVIVRPDRAPVTKGPYRFLRHPNYLAVIIEVACLPLVHGAWLTAIAFSLGNAAILRVRIRVEEAALGHRYAAAFAGRSRLLPEVPRD